MNSCLQFSHAISTVNLFETPSCCPLEFMKLLIQSACTLGKGSIKKYGFIHIWVGVVVFATTHHDGGLWK